MSEMCTKALARCLVLHEPSANLSPYCALTKEQADGRSRLKTELCPHPHKKGKLKS